MGRKFAIASASFVGSVVGLVTPIGAVIVSRELTGRMDGIFDHAYVFGGPLAGAVIGAVAGVRRGRALPPEAARRDCLKAIGRAAVVGMLMALAANVLLGGIAKYLLTH